MDSSSPPSETQYLVVRNDEEQYSIWPTGRPLPDGWRSTGPQGPKAECLRHIDQVWTDLRPLSARG
ncbi:MbtH family protein [Kitasatospora purpeofusca]|uniref:MbtH family protein n=1 Tax=Kitasatospora purpeofusca TaxID=67352 RepID=UPI003863B9CA|nr:MbtH family protein [Kitasatospora purpeofusca]